MNERIKELAEQAGAEIYGHPDYATICVNGQDADALMKKFARLLIQECADVAEDYDAAHSGQYGCSLCSVGSHACII